jgi:hypothetical protein
VLLGRVALNRTLRHRKQRRHLSHR